MTKRKALMSMADIEKRMQVRADGDRSRLIQTGGNQISTRNERFAFKGTMIGKTMKCTVVGFIHQNAYYDGPFDADNISIPACFALSLDGKSMAPPDNAPDAQFAQCDGCPQNVFGSADVGRGKKCKNQYRLAILAEDVKDAREAELVYLTLPPTSIKPWNQFVNEVSALHHRPPWGVMTEFFFEDADVSDISGVLTPRIDDVHKDALFLSSIDAMQDTYAEALLEGPDVSQYAPPKKRKAAKKKAVRKTAPAKKKAPKAKAKKKKSTSRSKFS